MPQIEFEGDHTGAGPPDPGGTAAGGVPRLRSLLSLFASERGRSWSAYGDLPELTWRDPLPQPVDPGDAPRREGPNAGYLWIGSILLVGFGRVELPDDGVGAEAGIRLGNEGESGLMLIGTADSVEEINVVKFYPTADCAAVLHRQIASVGVGADRAEVSPHSGGAGQSASAHGAVYRLRFIPGIELYAQCFIEDEGEFGGPGSTTFRFTRTPPFAADAQR